MTEPVDDLLGALDKIDPPDLWDSIASAAAANGDHEREPEHVTFFDPWPRVETVAVAERSRSTRAAVAVAAAVVLLVGSFVVTNRDGSVVVTDPVSSVSPTELPASLPTVTDPTSPSTVADAPVATSDVVAEPEEPGPCVIPSGWVQVCDAGFNPGVMYSVTAGGPGLVAVGSEDLAYYTREEEGGFFPFSDDDAVVWTSPDGLAWSRVPHDESVFGGDGSQQMFDVTVGGPGLVAVGRDGPAVNGEGSAAVWTSTDGLTWLRVPHDEAVFGGSGEQRMLSVTVGGLGLVAVGFDARPDSEEIDAAVWTSPDGLAWTRALHNEGVFGGDSKQMMLSVTDGGPGLVAVGSVGNSQDSLCCSFRFDEADDSAGDGAVWTSPDGLAWSRVPHDEAVFGGPGEQRMVSVTVGGPGLVAVGFECASDRCFDAAVWTSVDGTTWSRVPDDGAVFSTSGALGDAHEAMLSITAGGPGLVAVGYDLWDDCGWDSAVWTSPDGFTWSRVPDERGCGGAYDGYDRMLSVTVGPSGLVAVGEVHSATPHCDGEVCASVWTDDG